jgi:NADPH2:quinone reductase
LYVGQRVFVTGKNSGAYAEYIVSEAVYAFPLDERLSFAQGAALGVPYFTAYKALIMGAQMKPGETVLVHGVCFLLIIPFCLRPLISLTILHKS